MTPLFEMITKTRLPELDLDGPLQLQVSALDYSSFTGVIIGRAPRQGRQEPAGCRRQAGWP